MTGTPPARGAFEVVSSYPTPTHAGGAYLVHDPTRGDEMAGWSPVQAPPAITATRTPLTLAEGLHWLLQQPASSSAATAS